MDRIRCGMLACSMAGHDRDTLYLVCGLEGDSVLLCDGRLRRMGHPKKKNIKHIQIIHTIPKELEEWDGRQLRDEEIRRIIKIYKEVHDV